MLTSSHPLPPFPHHPTSSSPPLPSLSLYPPPQVGASETDPITEGDPYAQRIRAYEEDDEEEE